MRTSKNELRYDLREIAVEIFKEVSERETITNRLSINFVDNDKMFETIVDDTKVETKYKKINFYTNKTDVYGAITSVYFYETEKGYSIITKTRENKICNLKYTGKHKEKRKEGFLYFSYEKLSTSKIIFLSKNGILKIKNKYLSLSTYKGLKGYIKFETAKKILFIHKNNEWCDKHFFNDNIGIQPFSNSFLRQCSSLQKFINSIKTIDNPISSRYFENATFSDISHVMSTLPFVKNPSKLIENISQLVENISHGDDEIFIDTLKMCMELNIKFNFTLNKNSLRKQHDKILLDNLDKFEVKDIKVNEKYLPLKEELPSTFRLIETGRDLYYEGLTQKHCVNTYSTKINSGGCCILSTTYNDEKYTIEVTFNSHVKNGFYVNQIRGFKNKSAPIPLANAVREYIIKINNKIIVPSALPQKPSKLKPDPVEDGINYGEFIVGLEYEKK